MEALNKYKYKVSTLVTGFRYRSRCNLKLYMNALSYVRISMGLQMTMDGTGYKGTRMVYSNTQ